MNKLSLEITKIDFDFLLDNVYRPALWQKTWTIFHYGEFKVTMKIDSIYPQHSTLWLKFEVSDGKRSASSTTNINYDKAHRNLNVIENQVYNRIMHILDDLERMYIRDSEAYDRAVSANRGRKSLIEERAIEKLDELDITDDDIREAYIERCIDNNDVDYTRDVYNNMELTIKYAEALAVTSWFRPKKYNEVRLRVLVALEAEDGWIDEFTDEINEKLAQIKTKDMDALGIEMDEFEED